MLDVIQVAEFNCLYLSGSLLPLRFKALDNPIDHYGSTWHDMPNGGIRSN